MTENILDTRELADWHRLADGNVAVVAGTFDILQPGNLAAVQMGAKECGRVCVILSTDGPQRGEPWYSTADRAELLSFVSDVGAVAAAGSADVGAYLEALKPYVFLHCPECDTDALAVSIRQEADGAIDLPFLPGCSTGDVVAAIRNGTTPVSVPEAKSETCGGDQTGVLVSVNGCFDVLHLGHCRFLETARSMGDDLVVLLNDDQSVARYKGDDRPVFPAHFRERALCALTAVGRVRQFAEDEPLDALSMLKPAIHVKGGSYEEARAGRERDLLAGWGGKLEFCPMSGDYSTSAIMAKMSG